MKSPEIIQQLKKYQRLRRNQFLVHSEVGRPGERKSLHASRKPCAESDGKAFIKPTGAPDSQFDASSVSSTGPETAQPLINAVIMDATNTSASDTTLSVSNGIWSKSNSAFTSFTNMSNEQNTM